MISFLEKTFAQRKVILLYLTIAILAGISHSIGMFNYPYYENDEGTYMSQAWSLITTGKLAPYTYWYDHAPFGWIVIAAWTILTGGFFTFGLSVNSGRVLMLVIHIFLNVFLVYIGKKISYSYIPGIIASFFFSLSPLAIYFQRRVLLDNIMTFFIFLSLVILLRDKPKLTHIILGAIFFGLAVLTKENAIFFLPAFVYVIFIKTTNYNRSFSLASFFIVSLSLISTYFLYAVLKKEFFPMGFMGDTREHVSLLITLKDQLARGSNYSLWDQRNDFYQNLLEWMQKDSLIIILGALSFFLTAALSLKNKLLRIVTLFTLMFIFFLNRGKLVINFYIIPLLPLLSLNIGLALNSVRKALLSRNTAIDFLFIAFMFFASVYKLTESDFAPFVRNETSQQIKAVNWIKNNLNDSDHIVIDDYAYVDLHEKGYINDKIFSDADWFWKVGYDREVREDKYHNDWKNIEYIALSHEMLRQVGVGSQEFLKQALTNSNPVATFRKDTTSFVDVGNFLSTNGDWIDIYQLKDKKQIYLSESWEAYKSRFIHSYGQIVDPGTGKVTSEGQAYAMLRAVYMGDQDMFDGVWQWTKDHLQKRSDALISWLWGPESEQEKVLDYNNATDADEDIALSLVFAYKKWEKPEYLFESLAIITDIWNKAVTDVNGKLLVLPAEKSQSESDYLVNPSYFSPATYRIFAKVDTTHNWNKLADDSYYFLNLINRNFSTSTSLPPNWVVITDDEKVFSAVNLINTDADYYGYDAFRTFWRIALDYYWFAEPDAFSYLSNSSPFLQKEWAKNNNFKSTYDLSGNSISDYSDLATTSGAFSLFTIVGKQVADEIYDNVVSNYFADKEGLESQNYYDQNWGWFSLALYSNKLTNLWSLETN